MLIYRKQAIEDLGKRLLELRKQRGWSIRDKVYENYITPSALCKIEKGMVNLRLSTLIRLSIVYEISLGELLKGVQYAEEVDDDWDCWEDW